MRLFVASALVLLCGVKLQAQSVPAALYSDPPVDSAHPAHMTVLHIPTHGVRINGIVYQPSGNGRHPTLVICIGLPGHERSLDIAQAARRAGWNAVSFNYRGAWGSPGNFRFSQSLEDAEAVLAYLRDPTNSGLLGVDTSRIVLAGHSMGGWVAANTAARDGGLAGAILISAADVGKQGAWPAERLLSLMTESTGPLAGVTPQSMVDEVRSLGRDLRFEREAAALIHVPLLALTADDGLASDTDSLVGAIRRSGGHDITAIHMATDHNWSDHRIALEAMILRWLAGR
jgi:uncharacterized protein